MDGPHVFNPGAAWSEFADVAARSIEDWCAMSAIHDANVDRTLAICSLGQAVVTATVLNVRSQPSKTAQILGQLSLNQVVDVWAVVGAWACVQTMDDGLTGWCAMQYLRVEND